MFLKFSVTLAISYTAGVLDMLYWLVKAIHNTELDSFVLCSLRLISPKYEFVALQHLSILSEWYDLKPIPKLNVKLIFEKKEQTARILHLKQGIGQVYVTVLCFNGWV